jgi:hypothetical protein
VIERVLEPLFGPIASMRVQPSPYASSHPLELVTVLLAGGGERQLVLKDSTRLLPAARHAKPSFLRFPERELDVYRSVLPAAGDAVPELLGVAGGLLVLERVDGVPLVEVGELAAWERAARTAAALHRELAAQPGTGLPRLDASYFRRWLERARIFHVDPPAAVAAVFGAAAERIARLEQTIVHGELYASNVLVRRDGRACLLDWESAAIGPGLLDLAALTSGSLSIEERDSVVAAYADELGCPPSELVEDLECCRLLIAVQWLGWSDRWKPPRERAHDWRQEAERAARALA